MSTNQNLSSENELMITLFRIEISLTKGLFLFFGSAFSNCLDVFSIVIIFFFVGHWPTFRKKLE